MNRVLTTVVYSAECETAAPGEMTQRGQFTGGVLDGPFAFDNAIDPGAATFNETASPVARRAQILIVSDLRAGNMPAKNLKSLARADAAGIVLGARVPVIFISLPNSDRARLASCAVRHLPGSSRGNAAVPAV